MMSLQKCCEYFPQSLHQSSSYAGYQLKVVDFRQHEYFSIRIVNKISLIFDHLSSRVSDVV